MSLTILQRITNSLIAKYPQNHAWKNSKFNWIRSLPPGSKGVIGKNIGSGLLHAYGFTPMTSRRLLLVNGQNILPRMAMKWTTDIIKFQNIRDINFDYVLCFALYPAAAYGWVIPKNEIWVKGSIRRDRPGITPQHKGADAWIHVNPNQPPAWLTPYGGTIEQAMEVAKASF